MWGAQVAHHCIGGGGRGDRATEEGQEEEEEGNLPTSLPTLHLHYKEEVGVREQAKEAVWQVEEQSLGAKKEGNGMVVCELREEVEEVGELPEGWRAEHYDHVHGVEAEVTIPPVLPAGGRHAGV